jgi:HSP20 family protein
MLALRSIFSCIRKKEAFMREKNGSPAIRRSENLPEGLRGDPLFAFRQEMDRLFDSFFVPGQFGRSGFGAGLGDFPFNPAIDLTENEKEVRLRADLPGVNEKDVEISLDGDVLTIRGEKHEERTEDGERRRFVERSYGSFERSIQLPFTPKDEEIKADFKDGVLTVTAKKPPELSRPSKRIPIQKL